MSSDDPRADDLDPRRSRGQFSDLSWLESTDGPAPTRVGTGDDTLRMPAGARPDPPEEAIADSPATSFQGPPQLLTQPATLVVEPGRVLFGKYRVVRRLGGGAMGDVWLVRHLSLNRDHALKMVVPHLASHARALARFQREFQVMASFHHEHAIEIYDARLDDSGGYIDMQYVEGTTIAEVLHATRAREDRDPARPLLPLVSVTAILRQLCEVLDVAHQAGIVHRDLKPTNLMLVGDRPPGFEFLKVLDFGIAKIRHDPDNNLNEATLTGGFVGTPAYSSPEQVHARAVDGRSDLYSVGVILFEILTGRLPFLGSQIQVMMQQAAAPPPPFAEVNPALQVSPELERVVARLLQKDPAQRPGTGRALFDEFLAAAIGCDSAVAAPGPWQGSTGSTGTTVRDTSTARSTPVAPVEAVAVPPTEVWTDPATVEDPYLINRPLPGSLPLKLRGWLPVSLVGLTTVAVLLAVLSHRNPTGPDSGTNRTGLPPVVPNPPTSATPHLEEIPSGYAPVSGFAPVEGWPARLRRIEDETIYQFYAPRIYLPISLKVEPATPDSPPDLVGGWPRVLVRRDGASDAKYVRIPGGQFTQGAWDDPDARDRKDYPPHAVILSGFYIQDHEVSNYELERYYESPARLAPDAWQATMTNLTRSFGSLDRARRHPAVNISRAEAAAYAHSFGGHLPTEAQWEYAARSLGKNRLYVWDDARTDVKKAANVLDARTGIKTTESGSFRTDVTEQQVFDMIGNVQEWCRDVQAAYIKTSDPQVNPVRKPDAGMRRGPQGDQPLQYVTRGGSYESPLDESRISRRDESYDENYHRDDLGFRVVIECPEFPSAFLPQGGPRSASTRP